MIEGRRGAGRCNWGVLELEPSDAEQKNSVWGFLVQYIAGVSLKLLWFPKNFVFGPSWRCADRRCQIRLTGGEWQNAVPSIEKMLKDTRSKVICELEKSVALKAGNSGPIEYIYTHVACS